jgi:hypothetical protein
MRSCGGVFGMRTRGFAGVSRQNVVASISAAAAAGLAASGLVCLAVRGRIWLQVLAPEYDCKYYRPSRQRPGVSCCARQNMVASISARIWLQVLPA